MDVGYGRSPGACATIRACRVMERTNARALTPELLPFAPDLAIIDVSFISLAKVLGAVLGCLAGGL